VSGFFRFLFCPEPWYFMGLLSNVVYLGKEPLKNESEIK
jgi:hypothetical protein